MTWEFQSTAFRAFRKTKKRLRALQAQSASAERPQNPGRNSRFQGKQSFRGDCQVLQIFPEKLFRLPGKAGIVFPQQFGSAADCLQQSRVLLLQERKDPVSKTVPCETVIAVAAVFHPWDLIFAQPGFNLLPSCLKKRTDQSPPDRRYSSQAPASSTAAKVHQDSFGIVVRSMRCRDPVTVQAIRRLIQEAVAKRPGGFFQPDPVI